MSKSPQQQSFEAYKANREKLFDTQGRRAAEHEAAMRAQAYRERSAPKTDIGKQIASDKTILAQMRERVKQLEREGRNTDTYVQSIIGLSDRIKKAEREQAFKSAQPYRFAADDIARVRTLAGDDVASQHNLDLIFEAFVEHQDEERFRDEVREVKSLIVERENRRRMDVDIELTKSEMEFAQRQVAELEARQEFDVNNGGAS